MSAGELGPFASVGVGFGVPADPPELSEDPLEASFVVAGGVALVSVNVSIDAPSSGEAVEGLDFPVGEPKPDLSVGVPVASGVALGSGVGDPAPESGIEGTGGNDRGSAKHQGGKEKFGDERGESVAITVLHNGRLTIRRFLMERPSELLLFALTPSYVFRASIIYSLIIIVCMRKVCRHNGCVFAQA